MLVDYKKVNSKIEFLSYPMPTIEHAFKQFSGAVVFSVLDFISAYFQVPCIPRSRRAFCTPFGLFEFNRLPMRISVVSKGLTRVIDELFADLKGNFVFSYLDDLIVYSRLVQERATHVMVVLQRPENAHFTLNLDTFVIEAAAIKYLGHSLFSRGISMLTNRVAAIKAYPRIRM
jgi:hypothetical protein